MHCLHDVPPCMERKNSETQVLSQLVNNMVWLAPFEHLLSAWHFACRAQAALGWLVLNANQLESSPSHPGLIAMVRDFNTHYFYPPPPSATNTLHSLQSILKVQAKRTLDTQNSRALSTAHVKIKLRNLCNQLQENKGVIFEGVFLTLCCQRVCVSCV